MTSSADHIRHTARLLAHSPSIAIASLAYSIIIQSASLRSGLLDIGNPWWVLTAGLIVLLSPIYHAFVIARTGASRSGQAFSIRGVPMESFGDLVAGELLVNALVILGSALLIVPGIYIGLRTIYYKQGIVLQKARLVPAIRQSLRLTAQPRAAGQLFAGLAVAYGLPLGFDWLLRPVLPDAWLLPAAVVVSTSFLAWVNVYITCSFDDRVAQDETATGR